MRFCTSNQFLEELVGHDLYCIDLGMYVYTYNDGGSVVQYYIDGDEAKALSQMANKANDYWEAYLGPGGHIYDGEDALALLEEYMRYDWVPV